MLIVSTIIYLNGISLMLLTGFSPSFTKTASTVYLPGNFGVAQVIVTDLWS